MAKKKDDGLVAVRVLVAGSYEGTTAQVDDVIEISAGAAEAHAAGFEVDPDPAAVAYAKSLKAG